MSATARFPIKAKTLTLLELSQSISDFRCPPATVSSFQYQYQSSPTTAQILTRRLYLHPLTIGPNSKQQLSKTSTTATTTTTAVLPLIDDEQRHQFNSDKSRETYHTKEKLPYRGLAVHSSSLPLITRINPKPDTRHSRDKAQIHTDGDTNSDIDGSTTISFNQPSLPPIARGTLSSTHAMCTRPSYVPNRRNTYTKPIRLGRINVWKPIGQTLQRPKPFNLPTTPHNPPTTPHNHSTTPHYLSITPYNPPTTLFDSLTTLFDPPTTPFNPPTTPFNPPTTPVNPATTPFNPATTPFNSATTRFNPPTTPFNLATTPFKPATTPFNSATTPFKPATTPFNPATTPFNPATTPFGNVSDFNTEDDEPESPCLNYSSIQEIKIYKRNPIQRPFLYEDNDYDDYIYNEE
jgi:hypothetical protein